MVYERNRSRRDELLKEKETGESADVLGANHETRRQKDVELARFDETLLTMDHVFEMTTDEAMQHLFTRKGHSLIKKHVKKLKDSSTKKE